MFDKKISPAEILQEIKKHKAKTKSIVLETLNDLPDADIKPPENVLFVCKLNPVTTERDLETIFSVYGSIKKCDIIRDWKTGQSLQYAFIEYETKAACEEAYFKMDNALIDERRIHVDFSQSVSKLWNKYKHKRNEPNEAQNTNKPHNNIVLKKKYTNEDAKLIFDDEMDRNHYKKNIETHNKRDNKEKKEARSSFKDGKSKRRSSGSSNSSKQYQRNNRKRSRSKDRKKKYN